MYLSHGESDKRSIGLALLVSPNGERYDNHGFSKFIASFILLIKFITVDFSISIIVPFYMTSINLTGFLKAGQ